MLEMRRMNEQLGAVGCLSVLSNPLIIVRTVLGCALVLLAGREMFPLHLGGPQQPAQMRKGLDDKAPNESEFKESSLNWQELALL